MSATHQSCPKRADLHCHSRASTEADEAVLTAIKCPESFSEPEQVYAQAQRRGMDFFALTDHDTLDGVLTLANRPDQFPRVLVGEELTCYFPEDGCKMHVLIWGITPQDHADLQAVADDIYKCAGIIEARQIAHAVAHPLYRQNDKLERFHLERLMLMFKGFEALNGAHSALHREAFEPLIQSLTPGEIQRLEAQHNLAARWPEPWIKSRTGGSDDHGLFNIGRTWTEFPAEVETLDDVLQCLRDGRCQPGGEAGSSLKLAHNFFSVGIRYYERNMSPANSAPTLHTMLLQTLVGERPRIRKRDVIKGVLKNAMKNAGRRAMRPFSRRPRKAPGGTALVQQLFMNSFKRRITQHPRLGDAMRIGLAPLGEHEEMFRLVSGMNRDIAQGIAASVASALADGEIGGVFDAISAVAAQQFVLLPYYFALFHQNRERNHLTRITGHGRGRSRQTMRVGVFTDTFDEINGVTRFIRDMAAQADLRGLSLIVHTCNSAPKLDLPYRKNFLPLVDHPFPCYPEQRLTLPPIAEVLEWADRQQFDAIHVDTPGPMGLCGWIVASMLRVPLLGTYHTDFPAYVTRYTGDHRLTTATTGYMAWFYGRMDTVFSRSRHYQQNLRELGLNGERFALAQPSFDPESFSPKHRDMKLWESHGVTHPHRILYCGRVSMEKNLGLLADAFRTLCKTRQDTALIIAGDGPYMPEMKKRLAGLPVHFLGYQNDQQLGPIYASSDLFIFPSRTDTMGQVVIEAQASGLPVLVSDEGGPQEVMDHEVTGLVLPANDIATWAMAIDTLLNDGPLRQRMSRNAPQRMSRFSVEKTFDGFWDEHLKAVAQSTENACPAKCPTPAAIASAYEVESRTFEHAMD